MRVVHALSSLSFPARKVGVTLQPLSHFPSPQSARRVPSVPSRAAGLPQVGLPVRGPPPPWLPPSGLWTQTFLEALYKRTRLSPEIARGTMVTFPWKTHVVLSEQPAPRSCRQSRLPRQWGLQLAYREAPRRGGWWGAQGEAGERAGRFLGPPRLPGKVNGPSPRGGRSWPGLPARPSSSGMLCLFTALWIPVSLGKSLLPGLGEAGRMSPK